MNESKLAILVNPIMVRIIFIFCEKKNMPFSNFFEKKVLAPFLQQRKKVSAPLFVFAEKVHTPLPL